MDITYSKGRCGRFLWSFPSIHTSVSSSIHGWHHTGKKTLAEINNSLSVHVSLPRVPGGGHPQDFDINDISNKPNIYLPSLVFFPWSAVCWRHLCIRHGVQTSRYIHTDV
jgi:hypothetical protein